MRFLCLRLFSAGLADALRYRAGLSRRGMQLEMRWNSMHSDGEKPKRRLRVIDQKMPTKKDDLIKMIEDWNIPTPEKPTGMRAVDL